MRFSIANTIQALLKGLGIKSIDKQFLFSYALIALFAALVAVVLFASSGHNANSINTTGSLRFLSQQLAKETLLIGQGLGSQAEQDALAQRFESALHSLLNGNAEKKIQAITEPSHRAQIQKIETLWQNFRQDMRSYSEQPNKTTLQNVHQGSLIILKEANTAVGMMEAEANASAQLQLNIALFSTLTILVLVTMGRMFGMTILMIQIDKLRQRLNAVSQGDFTQKLSIIDKENEVGQMFSAYNSMVERISELIGSVVQSTADVSTSIDTIASRLEDTSQGVQQQHLEIDQVATAMNEMAATVREVASNTEQTASSAKQAQDDAKNGQSVIGQATQSIHELAKQIEDAAQVMTLLQQDSNKVGQIMAVISQIAEQTNLLALNAAIEAARAGEQGRGFAVVADEVRNLAKRTQDSTVEIRSIVEHLQAQSSRAASMMSHSQERAQHTVEATASADQALQQIVGSIANITDMSNHIATAAEEQSQVASEMDRSINNISSIAKQTNQAAQDTVDATSEIHGQMDRLRELVARFRFSQTGVDLSAAKTAHLAWKGKLRAYLNGKSTINKAQTCSHKDCALGKWYYGEGLEKYGHLAEMREIAQPHERLHQIICEVIEAQEQSNKAQAEQLYHKVEPLSKEVVALISRIESLSK